MAAFEPCVCLYLDHHSHCIRYSRSRWTHPFSQRTRLPRHFHQLRPPSNPCQGNSKNPKVEVDFVWRWTSERGHRRHEVNSPRYPIFTSWRIEGAGEGSWRGIKFHPWSTQTNPWHHRLYHVYQWIDRRTERRLHYPCEPHRFRQRCLHCLWAACAQGRHLPLVPPPGARPRVYRGAMRHVRRCYVRIRPTEDIDGCRSKRLPGWFGRTEATDHVWCSQRLGNDPERYRWEAQYGRCGETSTVLWRAWGEEERNARAIWAWWEGRSEQGSRGYRRKAQVRHEWWGAD